MNKFNSSSANNLKKFNQPAISYCQPPTTQNLQLEPLWSKRSDQNFSNRHEYVYNYDKMESQRQLIIGDYVFTTNEPLKRKLDPLELSAISSDPTNNITVKEMARGEFLEERGSDYKSIDPADFNLEQVGPLDNMVGKQVLPSNLLSPQQGSLTFNFSPLASPCSLFKFNFNAKPSQQSTKRNSGQAPNEHLSEICVEEEMNRNLEESSETSFLQIMTQLGSQENIPSTPRESLHRVHVEKNLEPHKAYFQKDKKKNIWTKKIFAPMEENYMPWPNPSPTMSYSISDNRISVGSSVIQFEVQNKSKKRTSSDINLAYGSFGPTTESRRIIEEQHVKYEQDNEYQRALTDKTPTRSRVKFRMNNKQLVSLIGRTASVGKLRVNTKETETPETQASSNQVKTRDHSPFFHSSPDKENEDLLTNFKKNQTADICTRAETFGEQKVTEESPRKNLNNLFRDTSEKFIQNLDPIKLIDFNSRIHEQLEQLEDLNRELDASVTDSFVNYDLIKSYLEVLIQRTYEILMNNNSLAKLKVDNRSLHAIKDLVSQLQFSKFVHRIMKALGLLYPICCEKEMTLERQRNLQGIKSTPTRPPKPTSAEINKPKKNIPKLPLEKLSTKPKEEKLIVNPSCQNMGPIDSPTDLYIGFDSAQSSIPREEYAAAFQQFERIVDECKNELPLGNPGLNVSPEEIFDSALSMDIPKYLWRQFIEKTIAGQKNDITTTGAKSSTRSSRRD